MKGEGVTAIVHAQEPGLTTAPSSLIAQSRRRSAGSGCGGGGRRDPNVYAFIPFSVLLGRDCWMKQHKERSATSSAEKFVSFIASGTFMSGRFLRYLMHCWTLSGSTELGVTIVSDGLTTKSRE